MSPRFKRWKPETCKEWPLLRSPRGTRLTETDAGDEPWERCDHDLHNNPCTCDISDPFASSNTSTYVVACLVELRVSARNEGEAMREGSDAMGALPAEAISVSFRIEDPPGRGCCR